MNLQQSLRKLLTDQKNAQVQQAVNPSPLLPQSAANSQLSAQSIPAPQLRRIADMAANPTLPGAADEMQRAAAHVAAKDAQPGNLQQDAWRETRMNDAPPPVSIQVMPDGALTSIPNPSNPIVGKAMLENGNATANSAAYDNWKQNFQLRTPSDNAANPAVNSTANIPANVPVEATPAPPYPVPQLRSPYEQQQAEYQKALADRETLAGKSGKDLDQHHDAPWKNFLKGALRGALQGYATNGVGGLLGGAATAGIVNVASPHWDERIQQQADLAKMDADNARRLEGLKTQSVLDLTRSRIDGINSGILDRAADNQRLDKNLSLNERKAAAKDSFDQWRMDNGDRKLQSYEEYQKARLALGDKQLLSRADYNKELLQYRREQLAQAKDIADARNQTSLNIAGQNNSTKRDIAGQTTVGRINLANVKSADQANKHISDIKRFMGTATIDGLSDDGLTRIKKPRYSEDEVNQKVQEYLTGLRPEIRKQLGQ